MTRGFGSAALTLSLLVGQPTAAWGGDRIAVFIPSLRSASEMENALKADKGLEGLDTVVFGKFNDFVMATSAEKVPWMIAPSSFATSARDYEPVFQFTKKGKDSFQFLLISMGGQWNAAKTGDGVLGVVEELERKDTKGFVERIMGGKTFKAIKRVMKVDDLMPLLALGNADYVLVQADSFEALKQKFTAQVSVVAKSVDVAYPVVTLRAGHKTEAQKAIQKMAPATLTALGFDGLREIKRDKANQ